MEAYTLTHKIALITGASRKIGIGAAIARELAQGGADIFITYYHAYDASMAWGSDPREAKALLAELKGLGGRVVGVNLDLTKANAPTRLFDRVEATLGPVDILVNNATYSTNDSIDTLTAASLDKHYAMNLRAMALLCVEFTRRFKRNVGGRIINLTSGQSLGPMPGELAYVATKGAVEAFTLSLSAEVARRGITVNAIDPGVTDTGWIPSILKTQWEASAPMGRLGQPEDAARLIRFLASEEAGWITGQVIHSTGGL
jgi:3-oxoacyl-[acyl-carrier protein] reductase